MNRAFIKSISFFALLAFAGFFTACQEEDSIMTTENFVLQSTKGIEDQCGAGRAGCYELVFPITLQFADSTTAVVNNYDEMKLAIRTWFEANGSGNGNPIRTETVRAIKNAAQTVSRLRSFSTQRKPK